MGWPEVPLTLSPITTMPTSLTSATGVWSTRPPYPRAGLAIVCSVECTVSRARASDRRVPVTPPMADACSDLDLFDKIAHRCFRAALIVVFLACRRGRVTVARRWRVEGHYFGHPSLFDMNHKRAFPVID